jgi:tRNA(Arg) A34 adenosine deaminase TadA
MAKDFMGCAIELSLENLDSGEGGPFGAVIVKEGKIIARGKNLVIARLDPTAHAEIVTIRNACEVLGTFHLMGCDIYTSCEPCPMCLGAIYWARLSSVYYANTRQEAARIGFADEFIYEELAKPLMARTIPFLQVPHERATVAFERWVTKMDKVSY